MTQLRFILLCFMSFALCSCGSFGSEEDERYSYRKRYQSKEAFGWEYKVQKTIDGLWYWFIALDDVYEGPIYDWKYNSSKSMEVLGVKFQIIEINGWTRPPLKP